MSKKRKSRTITKISQRKNRIGVKGYKRRRPKIDDPSLWIRIKKRWWKLQWRFSNWRNPNTFEEKLDKTNH